MLLNGLYKTFDLKNSTNSQEETLKKICHSGKNINYMCNEIEKFFNMIKKMNSILIIFFIS